MTPRPSIVRLQPDRVIRVRRLEMKVPERLELTYGPAIDTITARTRDLRPEGSVVPVRVRIRGDSIESDSTVSRILDDPEGFVLRLQEGRVRVVASTPEGALRGLTALERLAVARKGRIPSGLMAGSPDHTTRALHFVLRNVDIETARRLVGLARENQFNTLIVQLADGVALPSLDGVALPNAWSQEELSEFAAYARGNGLEFIPEIKLLSHQNKFLKGRYPELMYNSRTYDPRDEETYRLVERVIDDVIDAVDPSAIHIGHDELAGVGPEERVDKQLPPGEEPLPAHLFLKDVRRLHGMLQERDVETWMWGDMLVGADEFPEMPAIYLNGVPAYTRLRGKLPDDIVVCDWHYSGRQTAFPSTRAFVDAGPPVLGASWRQPETARRFSRYMATLDPLRARGMIATTWWLVQKGQWREIVEIVEFSGEAFWNVNGRGDTGRLTHDGVSPDRRSARGEGK